MRLIVLAFFLFAAGPLYARGGSIIAADGHWAALLRAGRCDAESRIAPPKGSARTAAIAGFAFTADGRRWGAFHAHLSRVPRAGASVIATIGPSQFLLVSKGDRAWGRDQRQEVAMIDAIRSATVMRIESRDAAGRRFADHYELDFAATAIDAAAARCAALQPRSR